ncbi:hypothetical protein AVEN_270767-1 [Araneus ventricosus]|uniref:ribonuclease H n=1 Tax=Araneus ventricosus TaxID=182803 RepID=A0A4Y2WZB9_ARAVE|nr:hypothetical protein AVEN_270767-1 [Araneus ventricosus]
MSLATELNLISREVEYHSLKNCIDPSEGILGVFFHTELQQAVNKADTVPALMKQMALQLINEIPGVDIQIYTDGSRNEENQSGSGIYIKTPREVRKIKLRNPDNCLVFRSELLAIEAGLEAIMNENNYGEVWILSDSRSSIQHLKDWNNVGDRTCISILKLLRHIGVDHEVHLQWILSHVDIYGNEVADDLAKQGTVEPLCSVPSLTFDEIYSIRKSKDLKTWRVPPSHDWYKRRSPGGSIGLACVRADQTALSRFVSGHLRSCSFSHGSKVFPVCAKCGVASASPEHILSCLRLSRINFRDGSFACSRFLEGEWAHGWCLAASRQRGISNNNNFLIQSLGAEKGWFKTNSGGVVIFCTIMFFGMLKKSSSLSLTFKHTILEPHIDLIGGPLAIRQADNLASPPLVPLSAFTFILCFRNTPLPT